MDSAFAAQQWDAGKVRADCRQSEGKHLIEVSSLHESACWLPFSTGMHGAEGSLRASPARPAAWLR